MRISESGGTGRRGADSLEIQWKQIIKTYHTAVEQEIIRTRNNFKSTKDDTNNFTLENSINARDSFKMKTKIGLPINKADLDGLYQFSK